MKASYRDVFWIEGNGKCRRFSDEYLFQFQESCHGQPILTASGDMRCAPIIPSSSNNNRVNYLVANRMNDLRNYGGSPSATTQWKPFYDVIQPANILIKEIDEVPEITKERRIFKAEAVFMRNLAYFFMVRAFGDVPYYTNAYNSESLPRTPLVTVLKNCLEDIRTGALGEDPDNSLLPWTYSSNAKKGIRATRGSVIALMMHINLWLVQFDGQNKTHYYQNVIALGEQLEMHNGAYELLDMSRISTVFRGGSNEGLFEIAQNVNQANGFFLPVPFFPIV